MNTIRDYETRLPRANCRLTLVLLAGALALWTILSAHRAQAQDGLVISEFLAINSGTIRDDFGGSSDYVELYNGTPAAINLDGYFLTDSLARMTQWRFPKTNLLSGQHLLVWASGQDRRVPGAPLHTNFKLDGNGEALALIQPDGSTIVHQYLFGQQILDRSFGLDAGIEASATLLPTNAPARYFVPADNLLGRLWTAPDFDDRAWPVGTSGFGFDTSPSSLFSPWTATDVGTVLQGASPPRSSLYVRLPFVMDDPASAQNPVLNVRYDDGFVAYLNGVEVARRGLSINSIPTFTTTAPAGRSNELAIVPEYIPSIALGQNLRSGTNILAIHAFNRTAVDGDFLFAPELLARRLRYGTSSERYFATPTPGVANAAGYPGASAELEFSAASRTFSEDFVLSITPNRSVPLAEIRYTTDGTAPGTNGTLYAGPMQITNSMLIRARLFERGFLPGRIRTEAFARLAPEMLTVSSDLPLILVHSYGAGIFVESQQRACMLFVHETRRGRASFTQAPDRVFRAGLKIRGSSSAANPKYNWGLDCWDEDGRNRDIALLGMPAGAEWIFQAPYLTDTAIINNGLASQLGQAAGRYAPRQRFAEIYLNEKRGGRPDATIGFTNYFGIYNILERITIGPDRVAIDKLTDQDTEPPGVTGGYLLNIDRNIDGPAGFLAGGQFFNYSEPTYEEMLTPQRAAQRNYLTNYLNEFAAVLNSPDWTNPVTGYAPYIDAGAWIDYHLIATLSAGGDVLGLSTFLYKARNGPISFGPIWDFDKSFVWSGVVNNAATIWDGGKGYFYFPWWGSLFKDPNFWQAYIDRFQELDAGPYGAPGMSAIIDGLNEQVKESWPRDATRWKIPKRGGTQDTEIAYFKDWMGRRIRFMETNFLARPDLLERGGQVQPGATVAIAAPAGATVYYTTDGTDPRALHGGIDSDALIYTGPIPITGEARIVARSYDLNHRNMTGAGNPPLNSFWSGPARSRYSLHPPAAEGDLIVSELNYDPAAPTPTELSMMASVTAQDFEFIELQNVSSRTLDFFGDCLTGAVTFEFSNALLYTLAPGGRLVLVKNAAAFAVRYGNVPNVAGSYVGSLANAGERLQFSDASGEPIFTIAYDSGWHPAANGLGFTLVNHLGSANALTATAWRPSSRPQGTPGLDNPAPTVMPRVVINEILANSESSRTDTIELLNAGSAATDISGWFLTDDPQRPAKYRIPNGTLVPAGGLWMVTESAFGAAARGTNAFQLRSRGDDVWLFAADGAGGLLGYAHGFNFGATESNAALGRYLSADGHESLVPQLVPTLGGPNSGPKIGPILFREIMYHPPDVYLNGAYWDNDEDEYIELENIGGAAVTLSEITPGNPWHLRGTVDFDFPESFVLEPAHSVMLVTFDPTRDFARLVALRSKLELSVTTAVLGPFKGKMDNSAGELKLLKPGEPDPETGDVFYIMVDQASYADAVPWPVAADGAGASLQRNAGSSVGMDPAAWMSALPSPGRNSPGGAPPTITAPVESQTILAGQRVVLNAAAISAPDSPVVYQWRHNGAGVPAGTNAQLILDPVITGDGGRYTLVAINRQGSVESAAATLTVLAPATIVRHPESQSIRPGLNATLSVAALGVGQLGYQWHFNGEAIPGARSPTLLLKDLQSPQTGLYTVRVTDTVGPAWSHPAQINVLVRPTIITQPQSIVAVAGDSPELRVEADGLAPLSYRWRKGSTTKPGETAAVLRLNNIQLSDAGAYSVVITNLASGTLGTNSATATVIVMTDADRDHVGDEWEALFNYSASDAADSVLDDDGDGQTTLQEFIAGTDPRDGLSFFEVDMIRMTPLGMEVSFVAQANRGYTLQYLDASGAGRWHPLKHVSGRGEAQMLTVTDSIPTGESRLYRLVTPQEF